MFVIITVEVNRDTDGLFVALVVAAVDDDDGKVCYGKACAAVQATR